MCYQFSPYKQTYWINTKENYISYCDSPQFLPVHCPTYVEVSLKRVLAIRKIMPRHSPAITRHSYNSVLCSFTVKDIKERQGNVRRMTLQFNEPAIRDSLAQKTATKKLNWTQMSKSAKPNKRRSHRQAPNKKKCGNSRWTPPNWRIIKSKTAQKKTICCPAEIVKRFAGQFAK